MAPIKPLPIAPAIPAKTLQPGQAPSARPAPKGAFEPGVDAPRVTPRLSELDAARSTSKPAQPANEGKQLFTLQALSAYAAMVIESAEPAASQARSDDAASARSTRAPDTRPARPGSTLDLKV